MESTGKWITEYFNICDGEKELFLRAVITERLKEMFSKAEALSSRGDTESLDLLAESARS